MATCLPFLFSEHFEVSKTNLPIDWLSVIDWPNNTTHMYVFWTKIERMLDVFVG